MSSTGRMSHEEASGVDYERRPTGRRFKGKRSGGSSGSGGRGDGRSEEGEECTCWLLYTAGARPFTIFPSNGTHVQSPLFYGYKAESSWRSWIGSFGYSGIGTQNPN
jgi:hypothetical protein